MKVEHARGGAAGTVTVGAVRIGATHWLEVVAYPPVLRLLRWYRGGVGVAVTLVSAPAQGHLEIERAGLDAPYKLRARADNPLEKLPPVQLRFPALARGEHGEMPPEPVPFRCGVTSLELTLPAWARLRPLAVGEAVR